IEVAVDLTSVGELSIWLGNTNEGPKAITVPVALVGTVGLVWRRRQPLVVTGLLLAAWLLQAVVARSPSATWELVVLLLYAYSVAAYQPRKVALSGVLAVLVGIWILVLRVPTQEGIGEWLRGL